jgi:hypothetical protein
MPRWIEYDVYQGANFTSNIVITDASTNTAMNLSSATFSGKLKKSYASANISGYIDLRVVDNANAILNLSIPAANTANIAQGRYLYTVNMYNLTVVDRISEGVIFVWPNV